MGTKRYHTEAKAGTNSLSKPERKKAKGNHDRSDNMQATNRSPKLDTGDKPRFLNGSSDAVEELKTVLDKIISHPQTLEDYPGSAPLVRQLRQTLVTKQNSNSSTANTITITASTKSTTPQSIPALHDTSLPNAPPICDAMLEKAVFTHAAESDKRKYADAATRGQEVNYERLEILGDAYLELMSSQLIWERFPDMPAGRMSQIREDLVKNETLGGFSSQYGFDQRVVVPQDHRGNPKRWTKVKADVFEAYVAAVVLSHAVDGYEVAKQWTRQLWLPRLARVRAGEEKTLLRCKEQLAVRVMGKGIKLRYVEERPMVMLEGGKQTYFIGVYLDGWGWHNQHLGSGSGLSKAAAGDQAAERALCNKPLIDHVAAAKAAFAQTQTQTQTQTAK